MITKTILMAAAACFLMQALLAQQKESIMIREGTVLQYRIYTPGISVNYTFTVDLINFSYCCVTWMSETGRIGQFIISEDGVTRVTTRYWWPLRPSIFITGNDHPVLCFSKTLFKQLKQNRQVEFETVSYLLKEAPSTEQIALNSKFSDALYAESGQGSKIWVLNNEQFPAILKLKDNPLAVDVEITAIQ
jgi:hypothetical protein